MATFALLLALASSADAFTNVGTTLRSSSSPLHASYTGDFGRGSTGGINGSTLVSDRRVDIDAPWGDSRPFPKDLDWIRGKANMNGRDMPAGSTGGLHGSTLVAKGRVDVDAPWGSNNPGRPSAEYYRESVHRALPSSSNKPGATGGIAGSSLIGRGLIDPMASYDTSYHRLHSPNGVYREKQQQDTRQTNHLPPAQERPMTNYQQPARRVAPQQQRQLEALRR